GNTAQPTTSYAGNILVPAVGGPWTATVTVPDAVACDIHLLPLDDPATVRDSAWERFQEVLGRYLFQLAAIVPLSVEPKDIAYEFFSRQRSRVNELAAMRENMIVEGLRDTAQWFYIDGHYQEAVDKLGEYKREFQEPIDRVNYTTSAPYIATCPASVS